MYYPRVGQKAPAEVKAAYVKLKEGYGVFIPMGSQVGLYDLERKFLGVLDLLSGR